MACCIVSCRAVLWCVACGCTWLCSDWVVCWFVVSYVPVHVHVPVHVPETAHVPVVVF